MPRRGGVAYHQFRAETLVAAVDRLAVGRALQVADQALGRLFGVNAIAAYAGSELMQILLPALGWQKSIYQRGFAGWMTSRFGPCAPSRAFAAAFVMLWWLIVWAMDRRGVHLKLWRCRRPTGRPRRQRAAAGISGSEGG